MLLVRLRSIGDAVLSTVLAAALRRARPGARIALALDPAIAPLFAGQPELDEVVPVPPGAARRLGALARIRAARYRVAIDLHGGPTARLLTRWSGAGLRVGLAAFRTGGAYDVRLDAPFKGSARSVTLHTVESNLWIARALGLEPAADLEPRLRPTPAGDSEADAALRAAGQPGARGFVVVHPGAALASKRWPARRFAEVARELAAAGETVLLARAPGEPEPAAHGAVALPPLGLAGLLALLARARLLVGNDSGPAHLAAAAGTPVVAVFGSQDPRVWRPYGAVHRVVWKGLACSPCRGTACDNPERHACLERIEPREVLAAARELLRA